MHAEPELMRPLLKLYVGLVGIIAAVLLAADLSRVADWPYHWSPWVALALIALTIVSDNMQFEVRRGWCTTAAAVAHIASAFLLPPGLAVVTALVGASTRAIRHPMAPPKVVFNLASIALAVEAAAHIAEHFGGPGRVSPDGTWFDPLVAIVAGATYASISGSMVALAVAIDQRRSFWDITRGKLVQTIGEVGLGLVGAMLAAMLTSAPNWAPILLAPAGLLYVAKRDMDRADRRSRHLAVTSAVGRAVAGTLDPERAFEAITERGVLDGLKLDGLGLLPIGEPAAFGLHTASEIERPSLCAALLKEVARTGRAVVIHTRRGRHQPGWMPHELRNLRLTAAAIPFGAGSGRPVGALIAWREMFVGRASVFDQEEMLVLKTLADYAAVALETARLTQETARLHHEAGQAEARREMESLREVARLKDEFLGQVSHELRTPLTIIHGYSELMADGLLTESQMIRQTADEIHSSSTLMLRLVDDLLDTSRLDAGRIELQTERVDLAGWLARVAAGFGQATPSRVILTDLPRALPAVNADLDRLGQVMNNLLSNAARYSKPGSQIRVAAFSDGMGLEIDVVDQGMGIAAEDCERIFEKFYRGKHGATLAVRGTGLGLAVARQFVEAHGGSIGVRSELGAGSTFFVRLPYAAPIARIA